MSAEHQKEESEEGFPFFRSVPTEMESLIVEKIPFMEYLTLMKSSHEAYAMLHRDSNKTILHALKVNCIHFGMGSIRFGFNSQWQELSEPNAQIIAGSLYVMVPLNEDECTRVVDTIRRHRMRAKNLVFSEPASCSLEGVQNILELLAPKSIEFSAPGNGRYLQAEGCKKADIHISRGITGKELLQQKNPHIQINAFLRDIPPEAIIQFIEEWRNGVREIETVIFLWDSSSFPLETVAAGLGSQMRSSNTMGVVKDGGYLYVNLCENSLKMTEMKLRWKKEPIKE